MSDFSLHHAPLLSRRPLDRPLALRDEPAALDAGWPAALVLRLSKRGTVRTGPDGLAYDPASTVAPTRPPGAVLLGRRGDRHVWAIRDDQVAFAPVPGEIDAAPQVADLRALGAILDEEQTAELVTAQALLNWHAAAGFCARDGSATEPIAAGWVRLCPTCGREEYPRTDAAIICLVHDGADRALLARQHGWPDGLFSLLAGFVEAGESLEACVAREIAEEVGVAVREVRYLGSQPWPFPRSIMLGFHAVGDPETELVFSDGEIAEARWFTRDEIRAALARGDWSSADATPPMLPGSVSIARGIIEAWADPRN